MYHYSSTPLDYPRTNKKHKYLYGQEKMERNHTPKHKMFTQPYQNRPGHHSQMIHEQSSFLPVVSKKNKLFEVRKPQSFYKKRRMRSEPDCDTQYETLEYLNQCEKIIQNLKYLTRSNHKKVLNRRAAKDINRDQFQSYSGNLGESRFPQKKRQTAEQQILRISIPESSFKGSKKSKYQKPLQSPFNDYQSKTKRKRTNTQHEDERKLDVNYNSKQSQKGFIVDSHSKNEEKPQSQKIRKGGIDTIQFEESNNLEEQNINRQISKTAHTDHQYPPIKNSSQIKSQRQIQAQKQKIKQEQQRRMEREKTEREQLKRMQIIKHLQKAKKKGTNLQEKIKQHKFYSKIKHPYEMKQEKDEQP